MTGFSSDTSEIHTLHAIKAMRDATTAECFARVLAACNVQADAAMERRLSGLVEEDEFAVLSAQMEAVTHLVPLTTHRLIDQEAQVPDFLARFQVGCGACGMTKAQASGFSCLVEVKSTKDSRHSFGGAALRRLREFADAFKLPLLFAVRFTTVSHLASWVVVEDSDRSLQRIDVDVSHVVNGLRHVLWNDCTYSPRPGLVVIVTYEHGPKELGIRDTTYGQLRRAALQVGDEILELLPPFREQAMSILESFGLEERSATPGGTMTQVELVPTVPIASLSDIVHKIHRLPTNPDGTGVFSASRAIAQASGATPPFFVRRTLIEAAADELRKVGALFLGAIGQPSNHEAAWKRLMGPKVAGGIG